MNILITSGGTKVAIDRVRHIANMSSGTFGSKIAMEALEYGNAVNFFKAENSKSPFMMRLDLMEKRYANALGDLLKLNSKYMKYRHQYRESVYRNFDEYMGGLESLVESSNPDVIILAAAVSDYGVDNYVDGKIRTKDSDMTIKLKPLPKVISKVKEWAPNAYLVGFKLLVDSTDEELVYNAEKSVKDNKCDMVVANDLRDIKNNAHKLLIVKPNNYVAEYKFNPSVNDSNYLARMVIEEIMNDMKKGSV
jgi:phosphopantothenate--cysteine ligase